MSGTWAGVADSGVRGVSTRRGGGEEREVRVRSKVMMVLRQSVVVATVVRVAVDGVMVEVAVEMRNVSHNFKLKPENVAFPFCHLKGWKQWP